METFSGNHGIGTSNERRQTFNEFAETRAFNIMNTFFEIKENSRGNGHKNCHLVIKTEIDFMITNKPGLVQDVISKTKGHKSN